VGVASSVLPSKNSIASDLIFKSTSNEHQGQVCLLLASGMSRVLLTRLNDS
jgi:hypothetical protein